MSIIKLMIAASLPILMSIFIYLLQKKTRFGTSNYRRQQVIIGILFGTLAIVGTEWGIPYESNGTTAMINCRDAAPLVAGLLFGGPAGIIAGVIGGVERWFAVYWGVGTYTRVACTLGTLVAGFGSALLRHYMFEEKKPSWPLAGGCAAVIEVFHLCLVFATNIADATKAIKIVQVCFVPMVTANTLSVLLATFIIGYLVKRNPDEISEIAGTEVGIRQVKNKKPIFQIIQNWLLLVLCICFAVTNWFTFSIQSNIAKVQTENEVKNVVLEIRQDILEASDKHMMELTKSVRREILKGETNLDDLAKTYGFLEISIVNSEGIIIDSNEKNYINFDMTSGQQSAAFLVLLEGVPELVQEYGPISQDESVFRKFAGINYQDGFIQTSYDADLFQKDVDLQIKDVARNRHIKASGIVVIIDEEGKIVSATNNSSTFVKSLNEKYDVLKEISKNEFGTIYINDEEQFFYGVGCEGYSIFGFLPVEDAMVARNISVYVSSFTLILAFAIMFILIYILLKKIVINQIVEMTRALSNIINGDLDQVIDVRSNREFASLSDDINATVETLKRYIAEAAARIDKELEFAKSIQESALPRSFQGTSKKEEFDIYATMSTAKEVGGDFYDYYLTGDKQLNFLIADVSGKGIPAAMFMMRAKSVLKSLTERGLSIEEVFSEGNDSLCQGNDAEMFVTAWQGQLDLETGKLYFANAGHNPPVIKHKDGKFEYHQQKANLVLAGMEGIPYKRQELDLLPGDVIFLFTDGVTEATNSENELFGEDRLLDTLNAKEYSNLIEICQSVTDAIDGFVKEADQFDDITMLAFKYEGPKK